MSANRKIPKIAEKESIGLLGTGSHGRWSVDLDETTSGVQKWYLQIDGPTVYLNFAVPSPHVIDKLLEFLSHSTGKNSSVQGASDEIEIGGNKGEPVTILRDNEYTDRYFIHARTKGGMVIRVAIVGADLDSLVMALRQVKEDLDEADAA